MVEKKKSVDYWNENIDNWGKFYLDISHSDEDFHSPNWFSDIYRAIIMPIEARLMKQRFEFTIGFISQYIHAGMVTVDVGCGTGIFTVEMLKRGAIVKAVDYAQRSLDSTQALVEKLVPEYAKNVEYCLLDVSEERLPNSNAVLAMGVTPYIELISSFYENILPTTDLLYCLIVDPNNWANYLRRLVPLMNVRDLHWFSKTEVDGLYLKYQWVLLNRVKFGTGYLNLAQRKS